MTEYQKTKAFLFLLHLCSIGMATGLVVGSATHLLAAPVPIVRNGLGEWILDKGGSFPVASTPIEIRRFHQLPNLLSAGQVVPYVVQSMSIAPDDDRLFTSHLKNAQIYAIAADGSTSSSYMSAGVPGFKSLVSIAFHPEFYDVGSPGYGKLYTYVNVTKPTSGGPYNYLGDSSPTFADTAVYEYDATFGIDGKTNGVNAASRRELFRVAQIRGDHTAGRATFNPFAEPGDEDYGLLYITQGDNYQFNPQSQNLQTAQGTVMRINPLQDGANPYSIPATNPFVGNPNALDEIFTYGHRNNHTLTFGEYDGDVFAFLGEIGEGSAEEINLLQPGANYGWADNEGTLDFQTSHNPAYTYPVAQFGHDSPNKPTAVAGGYLISNGSELDGRYIFGDFPISGDLFSVSIDDVKNAVLQDNDPLNITPAPVSIHEVLFDDDDNPATPSVVTTLQDIITSDPDYLLAGAPSERLDVRFGQGPGGELYITNKWNGWVYQVVNSIAPTIDADFDDDGDVDGADLASWQGGFGIASGAANGDGDANGDGVVDGRDFLLWQRNAQTSPAAGAVPEPAGIALLLLAVAGAAGYATKYRR
ncbi:MAG: PQQ-dependent sugar dehydrogenase [Planctomycetales bacterium]|nr:PQQ-dependent sugar dehydrogenase [Planctomycetales bacterium]